MTKTWLEQLKSSLIKYYGSKKGTLLSKKYNVAFPQTYQDDFSPTNALEDIHLIERLSDTHPLEINLYEQQKPYSSRLYLKLLQFEKPIPLSDVLPLFENMDLRTFSERPYKIVVDKKTIWLSDFSVNYTRQKALNIADVRDIFREVLICINCGACESDGFNKLILAANIPWRDIMILRAYAKYLQQIGFRFSQNYIERTLANYPEITKNIIQFFKIKFDPQQKGAAKKLVQLEETMRNNLETVQSLEEDRILRNMWELLRATLRTNYFQRLKNGDMKDYISFKFASNAINDLPLPHPLYEIFVYSARFEAIHLRSAKVARGGIRWSDRHEDFRTEILGLMKAQKVKNAIIVPSGAKGGFVLKAAPENAPRQTLQAEVITCYKKFMCGLLDITDNLKNGKIVQPKNVVCYDTDDAYLVVAADKGTSSFSDIANGIAEEYDFWLGDAFASGGSEGYDHKKMGITARGAWESIKRHFRGININIKKDTFTVVGIGDMSGDVFGNGMLYSKHIRLIAAFDHRHIFLDPNPIPNTSYKERQRLFKLPASSWDDYDKKLISKGGGVFSRALKSVTLSPEIKKALAIEENSLTPTDLIRAILKGPTDLLFNGGIGTYVKASSESQADVGDKTNEFCRVNGDELRCRVVGEGGNLGFTQLGRIEYALNGGLINTDFIDNSAGVDCSDHEVNLKILLNKEIKQGRLTEEKRNDLLESMTKEVADLVLQDNYNQALTMSVVSDHAPKLIGLYQTYLKELEHSNIVDRAVEFLPDTRKILERKAAGQGLVSPELAVLLAYTKIHVKNEILCSDVPEDPYLSRAVAKLFPSKICELYPKALQEHPLRREIIATYLSNRIVNMMGITFVYRIQTETGATVGDIIRAQAVASRIFGTRELQRSIDSLDSKLPAQMQYELMHYVRALINLATRWFLQGNRLKGNLERIIDHYSRGIKELEEIMPDLMLGVTKAYLETLKEHFSSAGVSKEISRKIAIIRAIYTSLNIVEVATQHKFDLVKTARVYFDVGGRFNLVWFRDQIASDHREGHWNTLARLTLRDELDILQKLLTVVIIKSNKKDNDTQVLIEKWISKNRLATERWEKLVEMLVGSPTLEYSMFFIAVRELSNWVMLSNE